MVSVARTSTTTASSKGLESTIIELEFLTVVRLGKLAFASKSFTHPVSSSPSLKFRLRNTAMGAEKLSIKTVVEEVLPRTLAFCVRKELGLIVNASERIFLPAASKIEI